MSPAIIRDFIKADNKVVVDGLYKLHKYVLAVARAKALDPAYAVPPMLERLARQFDSDCAFVGTVSTAGRGEALLKAHDRVRKLGLPSAEHDIV